MIRYAVIGTGWIAESFIKGALEVTPENGKNGMLLTAILSRSREKGKDFALRALGRSLAARVRVYTCLEDLAEADDIDAVYIASPNRLHYEQSKAMLESGKHVICEKPIAILPGQYQELSSLADEKKLIYMEAIMMLHQPQTALVREQIPALGNVRTAHIDFSQLSSKYNLFLEGKNPNIFNPYFCTGALEDLGIYNVYFVLEMFGVPEKFTIHSMFLSSGADALGDILMQYPHCQVSVSYSKVAQSRSASQILGDNGTLLIDSISQLTGIRRVEKDGTVVPVFGDMTKFQLMGHEAADFVSYITGEGTPVQPYETVREKAGIVCRLMQQLRSEAGIVFPYPEDPETAGKKGESTYAV